MTVNSFVDVYFLIFFARHDFKALLFIELFFGAKIFLVTLFCTSCNLWLLPLSQLPFVRVRQFFGKLNREQVPWQTFNVILIIIIKMLF